MWLALFAIPFFASNSQASGDGDPEAASRICERATNELSASDAKYCGECLLNGSCGYERSIDRAFDFFVMSARLGFQDQYAEAAWIILDAADWPARRPQFEEYVTLGANAGSPSAKMLRAAEDVATSKSPKDLRRAFRSLVDASLGGHYGGLYAAYYLLEASPTCSDPHNAVLVRIARLQLAALSGNSFGLADWNARIDEAAVVESSRRLLRRLNPDWNEAPLKSDWCRREDLMSLQ